MMIAYTLWRKDYTNSLYVVRLGLRHPAGFSLRKKKEENYRKQKRKEGGKQEEDERE